MGYDGARKHRRKGDLDPRTVRELARAIVRFGEIYERIELKAAADVGAGEAANGVH